MPLDLDVIVDVRTDLLPLRQDVALHRQGTQGGLVHLFEQAGPAGISAFPEGPPVQAIQQGRNGFVEVSQSRELGVTQHRDNPALGYLYAGLDLGLISGLVGTRRENGQPIVFGHLAIGGIQIRLVAAGMLHPGLDVVRDDGFGNATQEFQGAHVGANPAGQLLALGSFGERVVAGAEDGDEKRSLVYDLAGLPVVNRNLVSGVVHKQLFARAVVVPQDHIERTRPIVVKLAEPAVAVTIRRIPCAILFPQQLQREVAVGLQLPADGGEVRLGRLTRLRAWPGLSGKSAFQLLLIPFRGQWPAHAGLRRSFQVFMDGALSNRAAARDLPLGEPQGMEPNNFFELTHTEPFLRQWITSTSSEGLCRA